MVDHLSAHSITVCGRLEPSWRLACRFFYLSLCVFGSLGLCVQPSGDSTFSLSNNKMRKRCSGGGRQGGYCRELLHNYCAEGSKWHNNNHLLSWLRETIVVARGKASPVYLESF